MPASPPPPAAYAPIVVHAARERAPLSSVAAVTVDVPGVDRSAPRAPAAYLRVRGRTLQFWLFSPDNPQDRGLLRTGRHEGDWELVQVELGRDRRPVSLVASQHSGAERCGWADVEHDGTHPVVYAANGSHAGYFAAGTRDRTWPDPNDEADGRGSRVRPRVLPIDASRPFWMRWPGRWGATRAGWVPGESDSPRGPAFQGERWDDPAAFAASAGPCHAAGEPPNRTEDGLTAGTLAALAAAALIARRHRRRTAR